MSDNMQDMLNSVKNMINSGNIPDNIKNMLSNIQTSNESNNLNVEKQNTNNTNAQNSSNENTPNTISPEMISTLASMFSNSSQNNNNNSNNSNSNESSGFDTNFDINTIFKMKNIIDKMNVKDDPRSNLLRSLKPYLRDSRKSKLDQYVSFMKMANVVDFLNTNNKENK